MTPGNEASVGVWEKVVRELRVRRNKKRTTQLDPLASFGPFVPAGSGSWKMKSDITIKAISNLPGLLDELSVTVTKEDPGTSIGDFLASAGLRESLTSQTRIAKLFDGYSSDKSTRHDYHRIYGNLFDNARKVEGIVEIGIGSPNPRFVSSMGVNHSGAGGSLRAFRDFFPNANIFGFDIDEDILFEEERLRTYVVNQADSESLRAALRRLEGEKIDLLIDDGLHSIETNLRTLIAGLEVVRPGGWVCIEDIDPELGALWEMVVSLFRQAGRNAWVVKASNGMVFVTQIR